jgi:protein gp37
MNNSKIEWTDKTWNPVTGCTKVSQGCKNCYAEKIYERFNGKGSFKNVQCHEDRLTQPLRWKKPSMIFVNSMSDLFHEDVPFIFIDAVFRVMADVNHHTYQVLTKRVKRMLDFFEWKESIFNIPWQPSPNVWLGVSIEDQQSADERIPLLLEVPAAVHFLSCEPLLGPVNLEAIGYADQRGLNAITGETKFYSEDNGEVDSYWGSSINWVICGGESGHNARPMHPYWARSLRDQCSAACVPFFFKQWGEWMPDKECKTADDYDSTPAAKTVELIDANGKHDNEILLKQHWPITYRVLKVGKKRAGRLLDGVEHNAFPQTENVLHA